MSSSPEPNMPVIDTKAREAEYQALWQVCDRAARDYSYQLADEDKKRSILDRACRAILTKRINAGKAMCATDVHKMVESHIKRNASSRLLAEARLKVPCPPNQTPIKGNQALYNVIPQAYSANTAPFDANPVLLGSNAQVFNDAPAVYDDIPHVYNPVPQPQFHPQPQVPPMAVPTHRYKFRSDSGIRKTPAHRELDIQTLVNTLNSQVHKIDALEKHIQEITHERDMLRAAAAPAYANPMYNYPMDGTEGIEGFEGDDGPHPAKMPSPPKSQTQGMDDDDTEAHQLEG